MTVRILSVHGMGTKARIFAAQTAHFRDLLPPDYEFVFVDGTTVCDPTPEVADNFEGPYLGCYRSSSTVRVAAAHDAVRKVINEKGPFDAVLGFSQVCIILSTFHTYSLPHPPYSNHSESLRVPPSPHPCSYTPESQVRDLPSRPPSSSGRRFPSPSAWTTVSTPARSSASPHPRPAGPVRSCEYPTTWSHTRRI